MVGYKTENGKLVCSFSHRLDSANCIKWEEGLFEKIKEAKMPVVFDLEKVNYIASHFLRICVKTAKELGKNDFLIINCREPVKKVFNISNLENVLDIR